MFAPVRSAWALFLGVALMMLGVFTRPTAGSPLRLLALLALAMALAASAASGSRGAWLALPLVLALYPLTLGRDHSALWRWGLVVLVGVLVLLIPPTPASAYPSMHCVSDHGLVVIV